MTAGIRTLVPVVGVLAGLAAGCARRGEPVATVVETQGTVERNQAADGWAPAEPGFVFVVGDSVRTQAGAQARLRLTTGTVIRVLENARIRFARGALPSSKGADLNVELGFAEVETATEQVAVVTALGVTKVERGARVRVSSVGGQTTLEVLVGRALVLGPSGDLTVDQGEGARIKIGDGRPERYRVVVGAPIVEVAPPAPSVPPAPDPPATSPAPAPGPASAEEKPTHAPSTRADVTLAAGESGILHVAGRSLSLRLTFNRLCPDEASVELQGGGAGRLTGSGALVLKLHPGTVRYRLRCAEDARGARPRATGSFTVRRDSGDGPVSRRAPVNVLDADGRRYTVLFQTRLPALTFGWAAAPAGAGQLSLHVASAAGGVQKFASASARRQLASGTLTEGSYTWWYATADGRTSPKTAVTIRFDNAAPTAQFFPKRSGAEAPAPGLVSVDGVTIDGAKVSAGGRELAVDERGRFRADVAPLSGDDAVVIRLEHPRTGVHYYVRHPGSRRQARLVRAR
jgi:hypothetical protein